VLESEIKPGLIKPSDWCMIELHTNGLWINHTPVGVDQALRLVYD